jgi:glycosyltransferase involved in cell wall biosynthesis
MKISVVTISYNQAEFLRECIDSVLNQNYSNIEYIIVDPGSTDGSREIIDSYGDRVIKIYENDAGPSDGLNKGFAIASGDIFCYLNSDDVFLPAAFEKISSYFNEHKNVDVICGHGQIIDGNSEIKRNVFSDRFNIRAAAYGSCLAIQPSTFFKKSAFEMVGGFNLNNKSNWDGELLIDMALAGAKIEVINQFLSCYRVHGESITGTGRLFDAHTKHSKKMFEKIMGRSLRKPDAWFQYFFRIRKHMLNPKATIERIRKGPVFGTEND